MLCSLLLLLLSTFVSGSYSQGQVQNLTSRIIAGCTIGNYFNAFISCSKVKKNLTKKICICFSGGLFVLFFLLLILTFAGCRRRSRAVVNAQGRTNQCESERLSGASLERSHHVEQNPAPTTPHRPKGQTQAAPPPSVQLDPLPDYHTQGVPPPAFDPNEAIDFSVSNSYTIYHPTIYPTFFPRNSPETSKKIKGLATFRLTPYIYD